MIDPRSKAHITKDCTHIGCSSCGAHLGTIQPREQLFLCQGYRFDSSDNIWKRERSHIRDEGPTFTNSESPRIQCYKCNSVQHLEPLKGRTGQRVRPRVRNGQEYPDAQP